MRFITSPIFGCGEIINEQYFESRAGIRKGCAHVFTNVSNDFAAVAVAGLGPEGLGWNEIEVLDECKENIRIATAHGTRALQDEVRLLIMITFTVISLSIHARSGSIVLSFYLKYKFGRCKQEQARKNGRIQPFFF